MIPSPFESSQPRGTDCSKIANVEKAACQSGRCAVQRCSSGWNISPSGDHCIKADYQAGNIGARADLVSDDIPNDKISSPKIVASATNDGTGATSETSDEDDRNSHQQPR
jgi:hypothetical protein